ncbi:phenylalanyl-tRNA synthetase, alpha subunit [Peptoniphilus asaccharolyticus DSM 20463]|uniref:Phenylalanine--tRNA ligase alpha subunit n=1 Tax=Peptoniphilus asaccharolyticus DSM 20463 TaxID=573058 RepID=A0A1W1UAW9_PEPAS|nr:phenylalanine--tRNA ligase subunit alpha [Peptoniphilus asaccharolyticus]MBL7575575.1 phenylalanine--tRNA ligase subunit alpha [Peptoniphilus asaccharolyticus]SMB78192.1 phenylalanyl-tRNA synthetase, alpha subunit [Peptoniphilus asaccharolyticus DSM 20463]
MKEKLLDIKARVQSELNEIQDLKELDQLRVKYLGKKGEITAVMKEMGKLSAEERPVIGALANEVRTEIENSLQDKITTLKNKELLEKLESERIDITLNKEPLLVGHEHPLIKTIEELEDLFISMGFMVIDGPEVESVANNFDLLNAPMDHPSRDLSDTFYIDDKTVLRTQTSPVQIRAMKQYGAPLRMVCSGRVFRSDEVDATHSPMFHQLEGLIIDEKISMANLFETLNIFVKTLFGDEIKTRFRPHYFPFTEPSAEVDVTCTVCGGKGCPSCHNTGWSMELLGCGMVHPNVLRNCGIDPEKYSGFAFGMGIDRIAMIKYKLNDIRLLFENDNRFLNQF